MLKFFLAILFITFFFFGCKREKCRSVEWGYVQSLETPVSVEAKEKVGITVHYRTTSSCTIFHHFEEEEDGNLTRIKLFIDNQPCKTCLMVAANKYYNYYYFKKKNAGTYYLEFENPNSNSVWDTIVVK